MTKEIRVYVEGGGDGKSGKAAIRSGFTRFLQRFHDAARADKGSVKVIACGSRNSAFRSFRSALAKQSQAFNILLVDSEVPVSTQQPWDHLSALDRWLRPSASDDGQYHLMVQTMEAWIIADLRALKAYYGQGFLESAIPKSKNVEQIEKPRLLGALESASKPTTKGKFHKITHASELLKLLDPAVVCSRAPHCDRFLKTLAEQVGIS